MRYWLMKTEPETFGIDDMQRVQVEPWSGVRSHFARAHMRAMSVGDLVLFYHSNAEPSGVAGLAKVERIAVIDETQFDPKSPYFDERATREKPVWDCVDVRFVEKFPTFVSLPQLRADLALVDMVLMKNGRLSVQPVTDGEYHHIVELGHSPAVVPPPKPKPKKPAAKKKPAPKKTAKKPAKRK
ncbi:MAG TPA: EVE domain-containing protein [Kofleriaceae bacterium]